MTDQTQVRVRSSEAPIGPPRGPFRRLLELLLYPVFQVLLLIPAVRRWRRARWWNRVRLVMGLVGLALPAAGGSRLVVPGVLLILLAWWLAPVPDPDRLRQIAAQLGAPHTLQGGAYAAGSLELRPGVPLLLFVSDREVLVVRAGRPEQVLARYLVADLDTITVDGETYQPRYVSFAKEPPRLDENADHHAVRRLALRFGPARLELEYRGVFAAHLAEVAAHTLHDLRRLDQAAARGSESLPVIG